MKRRYRKNTGGAIGTGVGAAAGTWLLPGVGTKLGATLGGAAGTVIGGILGRRKKEDEPEPPATVGRTFQASYGFRRGGKPIDSRFLPEFATADTSSTHVKGMPMEGTAMGKHKKALYKMGKHKKALPKRLPMDVPTWGEKGSFMQQGGGIPSMQVGGVSHEAGGVSLEDFGRPDVEVERGESILFDAEGNPEYVFSALRMKDKPRTFAEEFERLKEKGDFEAIHQLQKAQEEQMGRKKNVTIDSTTRQAQFARYGGDLKRGGGSMHGYSAKRSAYRYAGTLKRRGGSNYSVTPTQMQSGGMVDPRTFYVNPTGGTSTTAPTGGGRVFLQGPGGTGVGGPPSPPIGRNLPVPYQQIGFPNGRNLPVPRTPVGTAPGGPAGYLGRNLPVPYKPPVTGFRIPWGPLGAAAMTGYTLGELATPGRSLPGEIGKWRQARGAADTAEQNRIAAEAERDRLFDMYGTPQKPTVANPRPEDVIMDQEIDVVDDLDTSRDSIGRSRNTVPGMSLENPQITPPEISGEQVGVPGQSDQGFVGEAEAGNGAPGWLQTAGDLAPYAADLFNIGVAATMREPERPRAYTPELMDTRISTTADEATMTRQARAILADPAASQNQKLAAMGQLHRSRGQIRSQAESQRGQIRRGNVQTINRAREVNQRIGDRHADRLAQFRGARASAISQGVRSIADRISMRGYEKRAQELEPMQLMALMHSMPTADRRAFIDDLRSTLPPGHRLRRSLGQIHGGV